MITPLNEDRVTATGNVCMQKENLVKFGSEVSEICVRTHRQTGTQTDTLIVVTTAFIGMRYGRHLASTIKRSMRCGLSVAYH